MKVFGEGNNVVMEQKIRELLAVAHPEVLKIPLDPAEDDSSLSVACRRRKPTSARVTGAARSTNERAP